MVRVTGAKYLAWEDAFEVDFEDGLTFLELHATIRKAKKFAGEPNPRGVERTENPRIGFLVHSDNGQTEEVSGSFVRERPRKTSKRKSARSKKRGGLFRKFPRRGGL